MPRAAHRVFFPPPVSPAPAPSRERGRAFRAPGRGALALVLLLLPLAGWGETPLTASSLGKRTPEEVRELFLNLAREHLGVPYVRGGLSPGVGLDCSGLVGVSFRALCAVLGVEATIPRVSAGIYAWVERVAGDSREPGDLVFFTDDDGEISHVGIYLGKVDGRPVMISAASSGAVTGVVYSRLDEPYWDAHYAGAGRFLPPSSKPSGLGALLKLFARPAPVEVIPKG